MLPPPSPREAAGAAAWRTVRGALAVPPWANIYFECYVEPVAAEKAKRFMLDGDDNGGGNGSGGGGSTCGVCVGLATRALPPAALGVGGGGCGAARNRTPPRGRWSGVVAPGRLIIRYFFA